MKNLRIFSLKLFFLIITSLREMKQYICSPIYFILTIIYLKIIVKKLLGILNLTKTQVFFIHRTGKNIIISKYNYFVLAIF